jgi:hypothetical protein
VTGVFQAARDRAPGQRAIQLTPGGRQALSARLGLDL